MEELRVDGKETRASKEFPRKQIKLDAEDEASELSWLKPAPDPVNVSGMSNDAGASSAIRAILVAEERLEGLKCQGDDDHISVEPHNKSTLGLIGSALIIGCSNGALQELLPRSRSSALG